MSKELILLVADYFKWKDVPMGWGFGAEKSNSERRLRRYLAKHRPAATKQIVIRRRKAKCSG